MTKTALVAVENTTFTFDGLYTYRISEAFADSARAGMRAVVPFGRGNAKRVGLVMEICSESFTDAPEKPIKIKPIISFIDSEPVISEELIGLIKFLKENTFCTYYEAFRTILPPGLGYKLHSLCRPDPKYTGELTAEERSVLEALENADRLSAVAICEGFSEITGSLLKKGALVEECVAKQRVSDENVKMVRLSDGTAVENVRPLTAKQKDVMAYIEEVGSATIREVCYGAGVTASVIKRLAENGHLEIYEKTIFRTGNDVPASEDPDDIILSEKQNEIFLGMKKLMDDPEPQCAMLRGVTGSGKTSIFIKLIDCALKQGKTAIMMVPEIALTPQMLSKFHSLFGNEVAVMHSSLSLGERSDEYRRIRAGLAHIVIGTRSAVFAPLENIGVVIMDEEGEGSYKSESSPRYHARDLAKQRCFAHNSLLVLASATPSPESYYNAKIGRYKLFELDERYNNAVLPDVYIVDMGQERINGNRSTFSLPLLEELRGNLSRKEQSILLLNRRGYRTSVRCLNCGKPLECPNCSLPLTYHKANGCVMCHCCGYFRELDRVCPHCGGKYYNMTGEGTQLIEDEISMLVPEARVLRMDTDTPSSKDSYARSFKAFADGEYDILVGTQMIAKGLNFPNVTLVGVLKTDNSLYAADFRAYERTFSLITQVVGRSGRGDKRGRAYIQTFSPEHFVISLAASQNYPEFFKEEIELRRAQVYPPFCDIIVFGFSGVRADMTKRAAEGFAAQLAKNALQDPKEVPMKLLGPAPNVIAKVNGRYKFTLVAKCRNNKATRDVVRQTLMWAYGEYKTQGITFYADINGNFS